MLRPDSSSRIPKSREEKIRRGQTSVNVLTDDRSGNLGSPEHVLKTHTGCNLRSSEVNRIGRRRHQCLQSLTRYEPATKVSHYEVSHYGRCQLFLFARRIRASPSQWGPVPFEGPKGVRSTVGRTARS